MQVWLAAGLSALAACWACAAPEPYLAPQATAAQVRGGWSLYHGKEVFVVGRGAGFFRDPVARIVDDQGTHLYVVRDPSLSSVEFRGLNTARRFEIRGTVGSYALRERLYEHMGLGVIPELRWELRAYPILWVRQLAAPREKSNVPPLNQPSLGTGARTSVRSMGLH